jgi:hypothetical protein
MPFHRAPLGALAALATMILGPAALASASFPLRTVAVSGQLVPGSTSVRYASFSMSTLNQSGTVAFAGAALRATGGLAGQYILYETPGGVAVHAPGFDAPSPMPGLPAGVTVGNRVEAQDPIVINNAGRVSSRNSVSGIPGGTHAVYAGPTTAGAPVVRLGTPVAGMPGFITSDPRNDTTTPQLQFTDAGDVVINLGLDRTDGQPLGNTLGGLFRANSSGVSPILLVGAAAPGRAGRTINGLGVPAADNTGRLLFRANTIASTAPGDELIYLSKGSGY